MKLVRLLLIAGLLLASTARTAPATTVAGVAYTPPFDKGIGLASSKYKGPCSTAPAPVHALRPAPETGRVDSSVGVAVRGCRYAWVSRDEYIPLGDVPAALVGTKALVTAVIAIDGLTFVNSGSGKRATHVGVALGKQFAPAQRLLSLECSGRVCTQDSPQLIFGAAQITISNAITNLPAKLWAGISSDAWIANGTGKIGTELKATLVSVVVRPAT